MNFWLSVLLLFICYVLVTLVGIAHTIINWKVFKMDGFIDGNFKPSRVLAYKATEPYHPLYNIILFPIFAYIYLHKVSPVNLFKEALIVGAFWAIVSIIVDLIGWVLMKHSWNMTFREMYVEYQPWITLIYIAIFISPLIAGIIIRFQ